jgi:SET domain-containing protein
MALLTPEKKAAIFELTDVHAKDNKKTIHGILKTNAFPISQGVGALHKVLCRFNHSCNPNICHSWDEEINKRVIFAAFDIKAGEEMYNTYIDVC